MTTTTTAKPPENTVSWMNPSSYLSSPIVTITTDTSETQYFAHKALLTTHSPFFEACLKSGFVEGDSLKVELKEDTDLAVRGFLSWLYTGNLDSVATDVGLPYSAIELYVLADKILIPELKNMIIKHHRSLSAKGNRIILPVALLKMREHSLMSSKLAHFWARLFVWSFFTDTEGWTRISNGEHNKLWSSLQTLLQDQEASTEILKHVIAYQMEKWGDPRIEAESVYNETIPEKTLPKDEKPKDKVVTQT